MFIQFDSMQQPIKFDLTYVFKLSHHFEIITEQSTSMELN